MRTTVDLPDALYRQAKAEAALRGRKFRDLIEEGLRHVLTSQAAATPPSPSPSVDELMQDCRGIAADAPADYATNPKGPLVAYFSAGDARHGGAVQQFAALAPPGQSPAARGQRRSLSASAVSPAVRRAAALLSSQ